MIIFTVTDGELIEEPHPYELGMREGRWQRYGCAHCDQLPGSDIHDPSRWDPTFDAVRP